VLAGWPGVLVGLALGVVAYFITRRSRFERSRAAARARTARVKWRLDSETMDVMTAASKLVGELGGGELAERPSLAGRARALRSLPQPARRDPSAPRAWVRSRSGDARAIALHHSLMLAEYASADERRRVELVIGWSIASLGGRRPFP